MRTVTIQRPVVDLKSTGAQIKSLRIKSGYTVHDIQAVFGFEYPQAVYAWAHPEGDSESEGSRNGESKAFPGQKPE